MNASFIWVKRKMSISRLGTDTHFATRAAYPACILAKWAVCPRFFLHRPRYLKPLRRVAVLGAGTMGSASRRQADAAHQAPSHLDRPHTINDSRCICVTDRTTIRGASLRVRAESGLI